jgi:hypothetical protein
MILVSYAHVTHATESHKIVNSLAYDMLSHRIKQVSCINLVFTAYLCSLLRQGLRMPGEITRYPFDHLWFTSVRPHQRISQAQI